MRNIKLTGTKNIRDLGGIKVKNGIIKSNKLIRASSLDNLTEKDINKLVNTYNLHTIIDLRTDNEIVEGFDPDIPNVNYIHLAIFENKTIGITHSKKEVDDKEKINVNLTDLYRKMLSDKEYLNNISKIIKTIINLADDDYSVIYHCTEGKDRTGIITIILLLILGASREDIINDYLYTNKVNMKKGKKYYFNTLLKTRSKEKALNVKDFWIAKEEYVVTIFNYIDEEYNNVEEFIRKGLKINKREINKFINNVVE